MKDLLKLNGIYILISKFCGYCKNFGYILDTGGGVKGYNHYIEYGDCDEIRRIWK